VSGAILAGSFTATSASPDRQSGRLFGTITDKAGQVLPGVIVTLDSQGAAEIRITDGEGFYRFSRLFPRTYDLIAELDGFSTVEHLTIKISQGKNTQIDVVLSPAIEETITVTQESPLLDEVKLLFGLIADALHLDKIPSGRDVGAIATRAAGVSADRVDVGGSESGELTRLLGAGSGVGENTFLLDGIVATDPVDAGGSLLPGYGFDWLREAAVTTGGTDVESAAGGVLVSLVTFVGTNALRGSARYFAIDDSLQAAAPTFPAPEPSALRSGESEPARGDRIEEVGRLGLELGGAILHDELWVWGGYDDDTIARRYLGGGLEHAKPAGWSVKVNASPARSLSVTGFYVHRDRPATGRGSVPERAPETSWDEASSGRLWKAEATYQSQSESLYVTGRLGGVVHEADRVPLAGVDGPEATRDRLGVFRDGFFSESTRRESLQADAEGGTLFHLGSWTHDLRFGSGYRRAAADSTEAWTGRGVVHLQGENFGLADTEIAVVTRDGALSAATDYGAVWAQDDVSHGRLSLSLGVRLDVQQGENRASAAPASRLRPELLPAVELAGNDGGGFRWTTLAPRLALTYDLAGDGATLLRAGYARFAEQLALPAITRVNPASPARAYFFFDDRDGDGLAQDDELSAEPFFCDRCADSERAHQTDPDLSPALTDELRVGLEHAIRPEWAVGLIGSYRRTSNVAEERLLVVDEGGTLRTAAAGDFVLDRTVGGSLPDGETYAAPTFALREGLRPAGGTFLTDGERRHEYLGVTFNLSKRLSNRWSMEASLTFSDWTWSVPASFAAADDPTDDVGPADNDGAVFAERAVRTTGEGGLWLNSRWTGNVSGLYQFGRGWTAGFNLSAREGYPTPYFEQIVGADGWLRRVAVTEIDEARLDDVTTLDLHLDKGFEWELYSIDFAATLAVEVFNVLDEDVVLRRERNLAIARAGAPTETLNPRVFQVGLRLSIGSIP